MGLLDKIKAVASDALFEAEPGVQQAPEAQASTNAAPSAMAVPTADMMSMQMTVNTEMVDAIRKAAFGRQTALTTLISAAENLKDVIPDQTMRMKAAYKTIGGRDVKQITDAVQIHLSDVDGEEMRFSNMIKAKADSEIGGLNRQAEAMKQTIDTANAEINIATRRIAELNASIGEATASQAQFLSQASAKQQELAQAETQFKQAAAQVRNELNGHKAVVLSVLS